MKKYIAAATILAFATVNAYADSTSAAQTAANSQSGGGAAVLTTGDSFNSNNYKVNSAYASPLVAGFNTCLGSMAAGITTGVVSITGGSTTKDDDCNDRSNRGQVFQFGLTSAAVALVCMDKNNRYAISVSGGLPYKRDDGATVKRECPMTIEEWEAAGRPFLDPVTGARPVDPPRIVHDAPVSADVAIIEARAAKLAKE